MPEASITPPPDATAQPAATTDLTAATLTGLAGWANLQRAVNVTFPAQLATAERLVHAVLRGA